MAMHLSGGLASGHELLDGDLRDLELLDLGGAWFLCAATGSAGGISLYSLPTDGAAPVLTGHAYVSAPGPGAGGVSAVVLDGTARLALDGFGVGAVVSHVPDPDGGLVSATDSTALPGAGTARPGDLAALSLPDGRTALYTLDAASGLLEAWHTDGAGAVTGRLSRSGDGAAYRLSGDGDLALAEAGGAAPVLLATDVAGQGVRSYTVAPGSGALVAADSLGAVEGLGVAVPTALETVEAHGQSWAVLAGAGSHSLSVIRIGPDGALSATDHVIDSRGTRFGGVQDIAVVKAGDHVFVLAGGADDGLSLFALLPDGRLVHLETLAHAPGLGLENVSAIEAAHLGGALSVFVSSATTPGITRFTISLEALGRVLQASGEEAALTGTASDDTLLTSTGGGRLVGRAGDDILIATAGGSTLTGGGGADLFVLGPGPDPIRITDFTPGEDRLDLSPFPMLRSLDQLEISPTATGARVTFGETRIVLRSAEGGGLEVADLFPGAVLAGPDRVLVLRDPAGDTGEGTDGVDTLTGTAGADTLRGGGGADRIRGRGGSDEIEGEAGNDRIWGGNGDDLIRGGDGHDRIRAAKGADTVDGGDGNDRIRGGKGDDLVDGRLGHDRLKGQGGNDRLTGGDGDDTMDGGTGADEVHGFAGNDGLTGGRGEDTVTGGPGDDTLEGGPGNDRMSGNPGADTFVFSGRHGHDRIVDFTPGEDVIDLTGMEVRFRDLEISALADGSLVETGRGDIDLAGVAPDELSRADFLF